MKTSEMHLQLTVTLLRRGRALDHCSSALAVCAVLLGLTPLLGIPLHPIAVAAVVVLLILAVMQKYWAQRVAIDTELFELLASHPEHLHDRLNELDTALNALGLAPTAATPRSLMQRSQGAVRMLRWQVMYLALQCAVIIALCSASPWLKL